MFWVTNQIMKFAPLAVFALIGVTVSKFGVGSLIPLGKLVLSVYGAMFLFILIILGPIAKICGTTILSIIKYLKDELTLAFSTASAEFGFSFFFLIR
jgi:proton glutamate symport protein